MRILSALYGTELFGRERENIECFKSLQRLGHQVQVFGSYRAQEGGEAGKLLSQLGLKCGELPFGSHFSIRYFRTMKGYWWLQIKRVYWCSSMMHKKAREFDADVIFLGGTMEFLYLWPFLLFQRRPIIYRVGDAPIWDSPFHKSVMKRLLRKARMVAPVSHYIAEQCAQLLPASRHKTHVIWNIPPSFSQNGQGNTPTPSTPNPLRIVYVGQMTEKKGVRILIQALIDIHPAVPFECRIVGGSQFSSDFEQEMRDLVEANGLANVISFTGRVTDPTPHYEWANLHVAPSLYEEPFGLVIVEAKRAGIPSIVFPRGGMPELVEHQKNGWVCNEATPNALAHAMTQCAQAPLSAWGMAAHQDYLQAFSQERFTKDWMQLLSHLAT